MTPSARLRAVLDLFADCAAKPGPADQAVTAFFRRRRYAGSKDRRAVGDRFYGILRRRARLDWWITRANEEPGDRARLIADLVLTHGLNEAAVAYFSTPPFIPRRRSKKRRKRWFRRCKAKISTIPTCRIMSVWNIPIG